MAQDKYIALLYKKLQGSLSSMEGILLDKWLAEAETNRTLAAKIEQDWQLMASYEPELNYDIDQEFALLKNRIKTTEKPISKTATVKPIQPTRRWRIWIAAASLVLMTIGVWWFAQSPTNNNVLVNTIHADRLEEIQLTDGTKVWIKPNSHFEYPTTFADTRSVRLNGEAIFDVTPNPNSPFVVETNNASIRVLGTVFNVRAIPNEGATEVIVKEGKVQLSNKNQSQTIGLTANEKGILQHNDNQISKITVKNLNELAWQSQVLFFKRTPLNEVIKSLERLFEKDIKVANPAINNCTFSGRYAPPKLDAILRDISREFDITYTSDNNGDITLKGKGCQ